LIIDTSAYSALQQGNADVRSVLTAVDVVIVPVIVVGELRYGFINGSRFDENENTLQRFLATEGVEIADVSLDTTMYYAQLYTHARKNGKVLSANDLWIAALAKQLHMPLLTLDKDFEILRSQLPAGLILV
jgi:tRNA(fMet)-specific endonuclease VapC